MTFVKEMIHDTTQTLSDHHPAITRIALNLPVDTKNRKTSYMKLNVEKLLMDSTRERVNSMWNEQMQEGRDPRVNWELGWKAMKKTHKEIQKAREEAKKGRLRLED